MSAYVTVKGIVTLIAMAASVMAVAVEAASSIVKCSKLHAIGRDIISNKSKAAAGLCDWAINIVKYYDVVSEVEPKRQELAGANEKLAAANTTLKQVQDKVALLNAQVKELEDQYNKVTAVAEHDGDCKCK